MIRIVLMTGPPPILDRAGRAGSINYFFRASRTASVTPPTAFWILPSVWSDLPSLCNLASPIALPMASLPAPLVSLIEPATLFLSMTALFTRVVKTRYGFGREPLASGIETLGEKLERRQPRKLLTRPPMEIGDARFGCVHDCACSQQAQSSRSAFEQRKPIHRAVVARVADLPG